MFLGRENELKKLERLRKKRSASLVVIKGRRRIGKSALVQHFGKTYDTFCEIQGLAPREGMSSQLQRDNFSESVSAQFKGPALPLANWTEAFAHLASYAKKGEVLILLDEISWMAQRDPDFAGKLKIAWDTHFKKNPELILVICGSVSSWIEANILKNADFVGRISQELDLQELPLHHCNKFWELGDSSISAREKLQQLAVIGGIPRYLEELDPSLTAEQNIQELFFTRNGMLVNEFEKIFNDIFDKRATVYREIVNSLTNGRKSAQEIAKATKRSLNGDLTNYLNDLVASGFLARDFTWKFDGKPSRISRYRLKDNYLRFYLKYVEPVREKINHGFFTYQGLERLTQWSSIMGLQFENLVLQNLHQIIGLIGIQPQHVVSAAPYFQNKTAANKGGCQIDLLIHTSHQTLYVCEMKFRQQITSEVADEVKTKIDLLVRPKYFSVRPVLIYVGDLPTNPKLEMYFTTMVCFEDLLLNGGRK